MLGLLSEGLTNKQIADRMFLAEKTVKNYVSRLLAKLGMERRTQAAVFATKVERSQRAAEHVRHDIGSYRKDFGPLSTGLSATVS